MSNRRVKSLAHDDDDFDDYDDYEDGDVGDDELSPEDEAQMRQAIPNVRAGLGPTFAAVTEKDIREALWHYYYDVASSVKYLKGNTVRFIRV
jgi:elongation factor 1 alpha-like protein